MNQKPVATDTLGDIVKTGKSNRYRKLIVVLLLLVATAVVWFWMSGNETKSTTVRYITRDVSVGDLKISVTATGTLQPVNQVDIGSELSGTVRSVDVDFNDIVKKGQVLARLDTERLNARVLQGRANLAAANAKLNDARTTLDEAQRKNRRYQELAKEQLCSEQECETIRANYERAKAAVENIEAQIAVAKASNESDEADLRKSTIVSPINGIVLKRNIEPGQTVAASFQTPVLFTIAEDLRKMELIVAVDEADVGKVKEQQRASFTVDAFPDRHFNAEIIQVRYAPQTIDGVVTYQSVLSVSNDELLLRPGMTATAEIIVDRRQQVLLVPNVALRFQPPETKAKDSRSPVMSFIMPRPPREKRKPEESNQQKRKVWLLQDNKPVMVEIKTGATDGKLTEVVEGNLKADDAVIVDTQSSRP